MFMLLAMGIFAVACEGQKESDFKVVIKSSTEVRVGKFADDVVIHYDILGIEYVCAEVNISNADWLRVSKRGGQRDRCRAYGGCDTIVRG